MIGFPSVIKPLYVVTQAADTDVQIMWIRKPNFPFVLPVNQILQMRQYTSNYLHDKFVFCHNTVTETIKIYKIQWLEPANNNVNTQRKKFWKCGYIFIRRLTTPCNLRLNETLFLIPVKWLRILVNALKLSSIIFVHAIFLLLLETHNPCPYILSLNETFIKSFTVYETQNLSDLNFLALPYRMVRIFLELSLILFLTLIHVQQPHCHLKKNCCCSCFQNTTPCLSN